MVVKLYVDRQMPLITLSLSCNMVAIASTVEPLNNRHVGSRESDLVLCLEVIPISEVD